MTRLVKEILVKAIAATVMVGLVMAAHAVSASEALKSIVDSYVTIQTQLAADKVDGIKAPARAIVEKAAGLPEQGSEVAKAATSLEQAADIEAAREAFGALTDAVMAAGKAEGWKDVQGVRLAFCPMVKQSWLQKDKEVRNPYSGRSMLTCGEFKPLK